MAVLSVQVLALAGLQYTTAAAATGGDSFANDGNTFVEFVNSNASTRTVTFDAVPTSVTKPGFGTIPISDTVVTIPGSGTNGGRIMIGPFPTGLFNDSNGRVAMTYSTEVGLTVAAIKVPVSA